MLILMLILIILIFVIMNKKIPVSAQLRRQLPTKDKQTGTEDREVMTHKEKEPVFRNI